jgi:RHS repeat-associated protein
MAARRHGAEKPHQGVSTRNRALHRGFSRCKSRNALGLRAVEPKTRVRSFCSGEQYDSDLGLYYLRARYYNANTGRFLSRDPEDGKPIDPKTLHKYLYVGGNPVNWIDPRGREIVEVAEEESEEDVAATKEAREAGIRLAGCFFGIAWTIGEIADENWKEALGAGIPTAFACYEFLLPEPPMPPVVPPPAFPPPPPPPGLPPNWCGLECWNPPPGTPIN